MTGFSFLLEKIFSGFAVNADTKIVQDLANNPDQKVFIVKKSIYYILFYSRHNILFIMLMAIAKIIYLIINDNKLGTTISLILAISIGINILLWLITTIKYLKFYKKNYGVFQIITAENRTTVLKKGDKAFRTFFDQSIRLMMFYVFIIVFFCFSVYFYILDVGVSSTIFIISNIFFFLFQLYQIFRLIQEFINLEMDFTIITSEQIKHYEQIGMGLKTQSINLDKVKSVKSQKDGRRGSLLNYGTIKIFTDGDTNSDADILLEYVDSPEIIEKLISEIRK